MHNEKINIPMISHSGSRCRIHPVETSPGCTGADLSFPGMGQVPLHLLPSVLHLAVLQTTPVARESGEGLRYLVDSLSMMLTNGGLLVTNCWLMVDYWWLIDSWFCWVNWFIMVMELSHVVSSHVGWEIPPNSMEEFPSMLDYQRVPG
jgi:hypothetical protein